MTRHMFLATAFAILTAGAATAKMAPVPVTDADGNGSYSWSELVSKWPDLTKATFLDADRDGDGLVTADEVQAMIDAGKLPA